MICLTPQAVRAETNLDPVLKKGAVSPYDGILLRKERYGFFRSRDEIASRLETENIELSVLEGKKQGIGPVTACLVGILVGGALVYVVSPKLDSLGSFIGGAIGGGLLVLTFE